MGGLSESVKKENLWWKSFSWIIWNEFLKICEKWYLLMEKLIKATRNKRSGGSILQVFVRQTFRTQNTSPNKVKSSKKYPLPTLMTYYFHCTQFYQVFRDFLVWYPSCACAVFSSRTSTKLLIFVPNTEKIQLITLQKNLNISSLIFVTLK